MYELENDRSPLNLTLFREKRAFFRQKRVKLRGQVSNCDLKDFLIWFIIKGFQKRRSSHKKPIPSMDLLCRDYFDGAD